MLLKRCLFVATALPLLLSSTSRANVIGDVLGYPFRWVGGQLFGGTVDKLKGAGTAVVGTASEDLKLHEERIAVLADKLVGTTNNALEARILQIKTSADDSVTRALSQVDRSLQDRLIQAGGIGEHLIDEVGLEVMQSLDRLDTLLRDRTADIDKLANNLVEHADRVLTERIAQIDEVAGRRLGDIDVIAAKQRIALESGVIRSGALLSVLVFVVFVLRGLWSRYTELSRDALEKFRGARRSAVIMSQLAPAFAGPIAVAACGCLVLWVLYDRLPLNAEEEARNLLMVHERALTESVARFDYPQARFQASHLGYLKPERFAFYTGCADKTSLLRDLVARPTLLATQESINAFVRRLAAVERQLGPRPDPDLLTLRAMVAWEGGATRRQEYTAASLAGRALQLVPRGFALAPLARAYVASFLEAPYIPSDAGMGRDALSIEELKEAFALAAPDQADSPLAAWAYLSQLTRELQRSSSENYVKMVEANARVVVVGRRAPKDTSQLNALIGERSKYAAAVVEAWTQFDNELRESPNLQSPIVMNVFRLNDALLTRALWFVLRPNSVAARGTRVEDLGRSDLELRVRMAPARIAWARRYQSLLEGPAKPFIEFEEAQRFQTWERWAIEFEDAMTALALAEGDPATEASKRWRVAVAAAALGLYVQDGEERTPFARKIAGKLSTPPAASRDAVPAFAKPNGTEARPRVLDAPVSLEGLLMTRGPRVI